MTVLAETGASSAATAIGSAISGVVTEVLTIINTNMPLVFGVALAFVAWRVGRRILGSI